MNASAPQPGIPTVLIVEDDTALSSSLKFALELEGFSVRTFPDGPALLGHAGTRDAACLVIDYRLPDMNGLQLLDHLRRRGDAIPAILITTNPSALLRETARRAGTSIVEKPLLTNALSDAIRRAISNGSA